MPFIRYTAKKILMITALSNTLAPMVKTYIRAGVIIESVIDCVRWASLACPGAFYIYDNLLRIGRNMKCCFRSFRRRSWTAFLA